MMFLLSYKPAARMQLGRRPKASSPDLDNRRVRQVLSYHDEPVEPAQTESSNLPTDYVSVQPEPRILCYIPSKLVFSLE